MLPLMERRTQNGKPSGRRDDGAATKAHILEAAGAIFAEKGFGRATGKEIAERAGTNSAAVNYYFGGIDGLYAEILVEAHHRVLSYEIIRTISETPGSPAEKLSLFIDRAFRSVLVPGADNWPLRVLGREMLHPSSAFPVLLQREILPKKEIILTFISRILDVPADHPAVVRSLLGLIAPFALLLLGSARILEQTAPPQTFSDTEAVVRHFQTFILGGLAAIRAEIDRAQA